ncbi:MAG TPA: sulfate ABC transporter permease subunit CysW [Vitreimonas sp.]|uniref:sulfate ABC transporter permease subunit CysW n=1 Tax=Vitreimonas sp. TaxID=3069702 RepID=UPI002D6F93C5|nr:sulfate ABC transporter permease subunit CysW [Vitreimonas sp.]HYD89466.1 sulfate ABC transporter permease subunit CysW [Vitreimonas sp.]
MDAPRSQSRRDPPLLAGALIVMALIYFMLVLLLPLITVFAEALRRGLPEYFTALREPDAQAAIRLTLLVAAIAVPLNTVFGLAAAWAITKFQFWGRSTLLTLIDLPFSISPVISGLVFVLLYGARGWFGPALEDLGIQVIFSVTGIVLATVLVTLPFVARELIPLMQAQGSDEEAAAATLGASGWRTFFLVTLPNIKWALMYGVLLCTARAMGEFGAVAVVSGHIRGETATMPLHVEILYNEYSFVAAFAVASLLALFALITLAVKTVLEARFAHQLAAQRSR